MNNIFLLVALLSVTIASISQIVLKMGAGKTYTSKIREYLVVSTFTLPFSYPLK